MPEYALFGGTRELMVLLCWASQASSGDCPVSFFRTAGELVVSRSLSQRRGSSAGALLVVSRRSGTLAGVQRRAIAGENTFKHCLASADIEVDGVTDVPFFFPQVQPFRRRDHHELGCTTGGI